MIDQRALLTIAQGSVAQATSYIMECLQIDPDPATPLADPEHQAFVMACMFTIVILEATLKKNIKNPAAREKLRGVLDELSTRVEQNFWKNPENPS